jgi:hypothetical protein
VARGLIGTTADRWNAWMSAEVSTTMRVPPVHRLRVPGACRPTEPVQPVHPFRPETMAIPLTNSSVFGWVRHVP